MTHQFEPLNRERLKWIYPIEQAAHSHPWSEKTFTSNFGQRYFNFLSRKGDEVLGYVIASMVADEVTLLNIAVAPSRQGQGVGRQLLEELFRQSEDRNASQIWLEVRVSNQAAIHLYHQLGFCEVDRRRDYYPCKQGREDAIVMCCHL